MNRLRENTGVVLWILVFAFGVIWVLQDSGGLDVVGFTGNKIAEVNGEAITFEEYNSALDGQMQNYQQQTGESMPPQMLDQTRQRVFDNLVETKLREQEMERLGLAVSDNELIEMVQGADPHPIITLYFGDGSGGVDRALLQNFIENPDARQDWIQIEDYLRQERLREKLDRLVAGSVRISDADVEAEYMRRNRAVDVRFVALRFATIPNDSVSFTDRDLRRFYDDNREEFARERSYTFRYVSVDKDPTPADTAATLEDLDDLRESFVAAADDSTFLTRNGSSRPWTDAYFRPDELEDPIADAIFDNPTPGAVIGPIISGSQAHLIKVIDVRAPEETAVRARHILFRAAEGDDAARAEARTNANDVLRQIRNGADFEEMAREHSSDASASQGGDLGWFGPGRMVPAFEEAAFGARVGRVVGPVETQFGYHLIEVTERATQEARIADFALDLRASVATLNAAQERLDDLQYFAEENGEFEAEAARTGLNPNTVQVEDGSVFIPGIGQSGELSTFLEDADVGDISPVIELNNEFIVGVVEAIQEAGYQPFEEVRSQLEPRVRNQKKAELLQERLQDALNTTGGFEGLAAAVGETERTANSLSYTNMVVPTLGRDPEFVGTALGMQAGETSDVLTGDNGVYVVHVTQVREPSPIADSERETLRQQLLTQRQNRVRAQWIASLKEDSEIVDNRSRVLIN
ncbi:MAG: peptidylprolyl isomerase [Rhodothermales bacterium]|nr:peptidylprolyl isomerase [Rhodothermales bacterium]MBO6780434.1 peptidylprolyl isomerase [Rhodothermales bacterium]